MCAKSLCTHIYWKYKTTVFKCLRLGCLKDKVIHIYDLINACTSKLTVIGMMLYYISVISHLYFIR